MAKKLFLLCCFWIHVACLYGQDIITRSDGVEIKATVQEIQSNLITFKLFQSPDTLVYQISPQDVQAIKMADGTVKSFTSAASAKTDAASFSYETDFGRNILYYHPFDLIFSNFTLAYERILSSGKVGFKIPVVLGFNSKAYNYDNFRENNRFGTGLEVKFYPFGQGKLQYFYGPAFHVRSFDYYYYIYKDQYSPSELQKQNALMYTAALKNGIYYHFSRLFLVSVDVGLGFRLFRQPSSENINNYYPVNPNRVFVPGNFHLGFRF